jgi:hypothetical protein
MPTLILTPRFTPDSQALWREAVDLGWDVERLASYRVPDHLRSVAEPVLYIEALFGPALAADFGLQLLETPEDWLPRLPEEYRRRRVELTTLGRARAAPGLAFVKPPNDKSFPARVYRPEELPEGDDDATVLVSEIVAWEREFRCFVLDRRIETLSIYLRSGILQRQDDFATKEEEWAEVEGFLAPLLMDPRVELPRSVVIDVGVIEGRGWAVIEANAAWGAGIYGCDPTRVLQVLRYAARPNSGQNSAKS